MATRKRTNPDMPMLGALMGGIAGALGGFRMGTDMDEDDAEDTQPTEAAARTADRTAPEWRPRAQSPDTSWLARVNADMERARRAGRQRAMV